MATVIQGSVPPSIENGTLVAQNGISGQVDGIFSGWSSLQMIATVLLILITYDQCTPVGHLESKLLLT